MRLRFATVTVLPRVPAASRVIVVVLGLLLLLAPAGLPIAAGEPGPEFLVVRLDSVSPDVVTTSSDPTVTVVATVTNVGDRPVRDVVARLEHGERIPASSGLRTSLDSARDPFAGVGEFIDVAAELSRGQAVSFTLTAPIRSSPETSLNITTPGVYPLLVNVNGTPDYGAPARLDATRFLLPVTGVPQAPGGPLTAVVAPDITKPVAVTMLWPLADRPRLAPGVPGGTTPVRLVNDDLAVSLAPGGRLETLVAAAEFATSPGAIDPDSGIVSALCLAVDPDLLVTVNAMTAGYVVVSEPGGLDAATRPGGGQAAATRPGDGQQAAVSWLQRVRGLSQRMCVAATPYAQADLGALYRVGDPRLSAAATTTAADIVDRILGITSTRGATILGDGPMSAPALDLLNTQGLTVAIAAAPIADAADGVPFTPDLTPRRLSQQVVIAPFDPAVGGALAGVGTDPGVPTYLDRALSVPVDHDSPVARRQDAVAAMLWRALQPDVESRSQILLPPLKWSPQPDDARAILTVLANAVRAGLATPRPLEEVIRESASAPPLEPMLPTEIPGGFDADVVAGITAEVGRLWGLTAALTTDSRTGLTGLAYTAPLREDMLRAISQIEPPETRNGTARQRLAVVGATIGDLFGAVTIVNPGDSYTLATENSALPLALRNDLAVPIRVRLQVDAPPGMTVTDIGEQELPPGYLPLRVPVEVRVSQRVAVDVTLRTADGLALGEPVRISVHANAYGKVLTAITVGGGCVLALLVGRRLYHRFRGQPDRADLDRPLHPKDDDE